MSENTVHLTEGVNNFKPLAVVVSESVNVIAYVLVTTSASVGCIATFGTGRIGNVCVIVVLCGSDKSAERKLVAVSVNSYYLEGVKNLIFTVCSNLKAADAVVGCDGVSYVLLAVIYSVRISAAYLVPRKLYLTTLLIGGSNRDGHITVSC